MDEIRTFTARAKQVKLRLSSRYSRLNVPMTLSLRQIFISACACGCCSLAFAQEASIQFFVFDPVKSEQPNVLMWEQMNAQQRAQLWPLLSYEQRLVKWRHMTQEERRLMRKNMTPLERRDLKRRFVIDRVPTNEAQKLKTRKMTPAERELLRRQVIQVHVEMRAGVPYNCKDPTDCRRPRLSTNLDVDQRTSPKIPPSATRVTPSVTVPSTQVSETTAIGEMPAAASN